MSSFQTVVLAGVKDVEIGVEDAVKIFSGAATKAPGAVVALTGLAGALDKALTDAATDAANPSQIVLTLPGTVADFKALWPEAKTFLASLGVK